MASGKPFQTRSLLGPVVQYLLDIRTNAAVMGNKIANDSNGIVKELCMYK